MSSGELTSSTQTMKMVKDRTLPLEFRLFGTEIDEHYSELVVCAYFIAVSRRKNDIISPETIQNILLEQGHHCFFYKISPYSQRLTDAQYFLQVVNSESGEVGLQATEKLWSIMAEYFLWLSQSHE